MCRTGLAALGGQEAAMRPTTRPCPPQKVKVEIICHLLPILPVAVVASTPLQYFFKEGNVTCPPRCAGI